MASGCSDDGGTAISSDPTTTTTASPTDATTSTTSTTTTTIAVAPLVIPVVAGPITSINPILQPQPATALPDGYIEEEFFIGGDAISYAAAGDRTSDGFWSVEQAESGAFNTRIIVRRPPADRFSGTVIVEWLNVTSVEASPDWGYLFEEIGTSGHAYVAVSTQALGVIGGQSLIEIAIDPEAAAEAGTDGSDVNTGGLVNNDPERYGSLDHPGDAFAYDIYTQVGAALAVNEGGVLGDLEPTNIIAAGESQSAGFLTTYVNAIHPLTQVYDGFFVHSRGAGGAPINGVFGDDSDFVDRGHQIRTDLDVPVFMLEAETDLTILGYVLARQDDTDLIRTWEVAGTAHADAQVFRAILGGPRNAAIGSLLGCTNPINTGPHHEVAQAALRHLVDWSQGGAAPPTGVRLEVTDGDQVEIVRDELGIALGGVRNPLVDVPVVITTGDPWGEVDFSGEGDFDICALFGRTIPIEQSGLLELHGSADDYVATFDAAATTAVADGYLLDYDAEQLRAEAESNRTLFE